MKVKLIIICILSLTKCFGQYNHDYRVETRNSQLDTLYTFLENASFSPDLDSLFINRLTILDGEKIVYWDSLEQNPHFRFKTKNGNIHGPFYCYNINGILTTVGNYYNDSLWSFRNGYFLLGDTTFKVGLWRYYALQNAFDSTYYSAFTMDREFKIIYDTAGNFKQNWTFLNGQQWESRVINRKKGLMKEEVYNKDGSNYSSFEFLPNCSITKRWDEYGNLKWIRINNGFEYRIVLRQGEQRFYKRGNLLEDPDCKREDLQNPSGEDFQYRFFYPDGNLMEFYDIKAGIRIRYDKNGEVFSVEKEKGVKIKKIK